MIHQPFDDDQARRLRLLNVTLLGFGAVLALGVPGLIVLDGLPDTPGEWGIIGFGLFLLLLVAGLYALARRSAARPAAMRFAAWALLLILWGGSTAWIAGVSGINSDSSVSIYFMIVILAALLLDGAAAMIFALASVLALAVTLLIAAQGWVSYPFPGSPSQVFILGLTLLLTGLLLHSAVRRIYAALDRAQRGERALALANAELNGANLNLEARVRERTAEVEQLARARDKAQQALIRQLQAPVELLWERVILLPIVGEIDANRGDSLFQAMCAGIDRHRAQVVILSIAGVPAIDEPAARSIVHLAWTARLLGARCLLAGVRPDVAMSLVASGMDWAGIESYDRLQAALQRALALSGQAVVGPADLALAATRMMAERFKIAATHLI